MIKRALVKSIETENRMVAARDEGRGPGVVLFNGYSISDLQDEKALDICCTAVRIYLTLQNWTLKNGEDGQFYVRAFVLTTIKQTKTKQNKKEHRESGRRFGGAGHLSLSCPTCQPFLRLPSSQECHQQLRWSTPAPHHVDPVRAELHTSDLRW